ncbi:MAG TPA: DUF542 domain-containing protein [Longimicrobium sp.]|nr:DUF542 domain-containing protein [Longimicrobium sp.]
MKTKETIPATLTVSEAIWQFPLSVAVFHAHGIDVCCGGGLTIAEAARRHGVVAAGAAGGADADGGAVGVRGYGASTRSTLP